MIDKLQNIPEETWKEYVEKAYILGDRYERQYHGCGQCVLAAIFDTLDIYDENVFRAATGLSGGLGLIGNSTCAALIGSVLTFGLVYPRRREHFDGDRENKYRTFKMAQEMQKRCLEQYGSIKCHDIHTNLMGRPFDLRDPEERSAFELAGAHDSKCTQVVALAAKWAVEILAEEILSDKRMDNAVG